MATQQQPQLHPAIPRVLCPRCGSQMRLAQISPSVTGYGDTESFDCVCGFTFGHTARPVRKPDDDDAR